MGLGFMTALAGMFMSVPLMYKRKNTDQRSYNSECNKFYTANLRCTTIILNCHTN